MNGLGKQMPSSMLRGWIRGKAPTYGKITKDSNRSSDYLRRFQYRSIHDFEYITYGDGHDDYNENWLDNVYDSWLQQQQPPQPEIGDAVKIQRKAVIPKRRKRIKKLAMPMPPIAPFPFAYSAAPPMASFESMQMPAPAPMARCGNVQNDMVTDKEYKKTEREEKEYMALGEKYVSTMSE
eukprot:CAMPEP_0197072288 /NCGR_PEP_ID=MMETSP1384-20130603/210022_1 /TAXON_ID=29189 /ORGANISM="Ammonia sp." /LENGTH=179 /DNA_ID=CAMNT_0042511105 /DNA_START=167 /DNA_END=703 /DNA_ORIENTATION=-